MKLLTAKNVEQIQSFGRRAVDLRTVLEAMQEDLIDRAYTCEADVHSKAHRDDVENILDDISEAETLLESVIEKLERANSEAVDFYLRTTPK